MAIQVHAGCMHVDDYDGFRELFPLAGSYQFNTPPSEGVAVNVESLAQLEEMRAATKPRDLTIPAVPGQVDYSVQCGLTRHCLQIRAGEKDPEPIAEVSFQEWRNNTYPTE